MTSETDRAAYLATFGRQARRLREARSLILATVATGAELTAGYLAEVECGRRVIRIGEVFRLADAIGVEPGELFAEHGA